MSFLLRMMEVLLAWFLGSAGNLVLLVVVGRSFGPEATGLFYAATATGFIAAQIGSFRLSRYTLRYVRPVGQGGTDANGIKFVGFLLALVTSASGVALAAAMGAGLSQVGFSYVACAAMLGGSIAAQAIVADLLKAQGRPGLALLIESSLLPWGTALAVAMLARSASAMSATNAVAWPIFVLLFVSLGLSAMVMLFPLGGRLRLGSGLVLVS